MDQSRHKSPWTDHNSVLQIDDVLCKAAEVGAVLLLEPGLGNCFIIVSKVPDGTAAVKEALSEDVKTQTQT